VTESEVSTRFLRASTDYVLYTHFCLLVPYKLSSRTSVHSSKLTLLDCNHVKLQLRAKLKIIFDKSNPYFAYARLHTQHIICRNHIEFASILRNILVLIK
jgi:hypothetical protein